MNMDPLGKFSLAHRVCPKCPQKPQVIGTLIANSKGDLYKAIGAKPCHVGSVLFFGMNARNADSGRVAFPTLNLFASITKSTTLPTWMEKHATTTRCGERLIITIGRKKAGWYNTCSNTIFIQEIQRGHQVTRRKEHRRVWVH
jgi:hypothetical protein